MGIAHVYSEVQSTAGWLPMATGVKPPACLCSPTGHAQPPWKKSRMGRWVDALPMRGIGTFVEVEPSSTEPSGTETYGTITARPWATASACEAAASVLGATAAALTCTFCKSKTTHLCLTSPVQRAEHRALRGEQQWGTQEGRAALAKSAVRVKDGHGCAKQQQVQILSITSCSSSWHSLSLITHQGGQGGSE